MTGSPRLIAAVVGGLVLLFQLPVARAQSPPQAVTGLASLIPGSIGGVVQDERGGPIPGAIVSAVGGKTAVAVTDRGGRFEIGSLSVGPYLVRAHIAGYFSPSGQIVEVRPAVRTLSSIALRRVEAVSASSATAVTSALPLLAAGVGVQTEGLEPAGSAPAEPWRSEPAADSSPPSADDNHGETAWRLRHLRRGVLKDVTVPDSLLADQRPRDSNVMNLVAGVPFTGQFNLLTTGSFDTPGQLFGGDNFSRSIAYFSVAAPVTDQATWSMRGALTQNDISSWFVAGAYSTRSPARHRYDLGLSYSTQRYEGGNPSAVRKVTDESRNVGAVYGFDTFRLTPAVALTYGARFSRYGYLTESGLFSPRIELTLSPSRHTRLTTLVSSRALAPGAEEFLPPLDTGLWLPPQRTFSSIVEGRPLRSERTEHLAMEAEGDFGTATLSVRAFWQQVSDQLVTVFGLDVPSAERPVPGHYFVGNTGNVDAAGWGAGFRTTFVSRLHGSVDYSLTRARWSRTDDEAYMLVLAPSAARPDLDRVHDLTTGIETDVPETSTRILIVYRLSSLGPRAVPDRPSYDSRFDVQVHQSLPFMDFSTARWEMLVAVRNTFHEGRAGSSVYDELLVVRPPKRVVGGLTLRF